PQTTPLPHNTLVYNVNGLNNPVKRAQIWHDCKKVKAKIIMLQETHFKENHVPITQVNHFPQIFYSNNPVKKATGVMTLIHKDIPFKLQDKLSDNEGRFLLIKGEIASLKITLANIYAPNKGQTSFLCKFLKTLEDFQEGLTIIGGD
uniref:exodeoxyribonuclease III n=1 Tax=Xenopus tropicalis TaxID=8364 RepID=A0A6I8Q0W0_XENTR